MTTASGDSRVVVVGNGLIGNAIATRLASEGLAPIVVTKDTARPLPEGAERYVVREGLAETFDRILHDDDVVFACHGPARPRAELGATAALLTATCEPTAELVASIDRRSGVRLIAFSSGGAVYGSGPASFTEQSPLAPQTPYGVAKAAEELIYGLSGSTTSVTILRCSTVFGRRHGGSTTHGLIDIAIDRLSKGEPMHLFGDGESRRGYLFVDDLAQIAWSLASTSSSAAVYNVCSGQHLTARQAVLVTADALGVDARIELVDVDDRDVLIDNSAVLTALNGFEFRPIDAAIRELIAT